jgi:hypothetical protein
VNQPQPIPQIVVVRVPAGRGLAWWTQAFSWLFRDLRQFGVWVAMALSAVGITILLQGLWLIGFILSMVAWFELAGLMMIAAERSSQGRRVRYFERPPKFRDVIGALAGLGLVTLVVLGVLFAVAVFGGLAAAVASLLSAWSRAGMSDPAIEALDLLGSVSLSWLICLCALVPLTMATWLAPALVVRHRLTAVAALHLSLVASWRNAGALTVYGVAFVLLSFAATLPLLAGWLVLLPLMILSTYAAYLDLFNDAAEVLEARPAVRG